MKYLRDLFWIVPSSLILGLTLSLLGPGTWWLGWLAYFFLLVFGLWVLSALWRSAGAPPALLVMLLLAVILRLGLGIAFSYILPVYGYDTPVQQAGFAVRDAFSYDTQAWKLATSGDPLWRAFDRSYKSENQYDDQYGGLLFFHSLFYRFLSPDAHRPWLLILMSAMASALGVALAWKGARQVWGESVAGIAGWIMVLYPESLLAGSSPVREAFLVMFIAMIFWGTVDWLANHRRSAGAWLAGGLIGLVLYSPGVAAIALIVTGIWAWLMEKERRIRWWWFAGAAAVIVMIALLLGVIVGGALQAPSGPLANLFNWLHYSAKYGAYLTELHSGWIEYVLDALPNPLHLPFIVLYGIAQPVLPAAIVDSTVWPMWILGILRGLGWYALLPLLVYGLRPVWKTQLLRERLAWLWLWFAAWAWIILSAFRAGGDQWNNPRYRVFLLLFQAVLAAKALTWQREARDPWLWRLLAMEGVFLAVFGEWYIGRYTAYNGFLTLGQGAAIIVGAIILIFLGGWGWDNWRGKSART